MHNKLFYLSEELWSKLGAETIGITKPDMFSHKFVANHCRRGKVERGKAGFPPSSSVEVKYAKLA